MSRQLNLSLTPSTNYSNNLPLIRTPHYVGSNCSVGDRRTCVPCSLISSTSVFRAQLLISLPVNRAPHWWVFKLLRLGSTNVCALVDYIITSSSFFMSCPALKKKSLPCKFCTFFSKQYSPKHCMIIYLLMCALCSRTLLASRAQPLKYYLQSVPFFLTVFALCIV